MVLAARGGDFSGDVKALTDDEGVDCVLDTVGTPVFAPTRRSLARGGRWVLVGQLTGEFVPFNPAQLFLKGISMLSATSTTREELRLSMQLLRHGAIRAMLGPRFRAVAGERGAGAGAVGSRGRARAAHAGKLTHVAAQSVPAWRARARPFQLPAGSVRRSVAGRFRCRGDEGRAAAGRRHAAAWSARRRWNAAVPRRAECRQDDLSAGSEGMRRANRRCCRWQRRRTC